MIANAGATPSPPFNQQKYAKLLAKAAPTVIHTEAGYDHVITQIESLLKKGNRISAEEEQLLDLLSTLVEKYEDEHYPIESSTPHELLQHLMEARGLKQKDLVPIFGSSGRASEAMNGVRSFSKQQGKTLAKFFHVSATLFLTTD